MLLASGCLAPNHLCSLSNLIATSFENHKVASHNIIQHVTCKLNRDLGKKMSYHLALASRINDDTCSSVTELDSLKIPCIKISQLIPQPRNIKFFFWIFRILKRRVVKLPLFDYTPWTRSRHIAVASAQQKPGSPRHSTAAQTKTQQRQMTCRLHCLWILF